MKKYWLTMICVTAGLMCFFVSVPCAEERATPQEVIEKVNAAAVFLSKAGNEGLKSFTDKNSQWVWKDTYVWVLHCEQGTNAAHPIKPQLAGMNLSGIKDTKGKLFFIEFCNVAKNSNGGWVEYMWPKVNEKTPSRKITYVLQVPDMPYQVAAGIYDENISIQNLNKMIQK